MFSFVLNIVSAKLWHENENRRIVSETFGLQDIKEWGSLFIFHIQGHHLSIMALQRNHQLIKARDILCNIEIIRLTDSHLTAFPSNNSLFPRKYKCVHLSSACGFTNNRKF